jgi:hypothetical protein
MGTRLVRAVRACRGTLLLIAVILCIVHADTLRVALGRLLYLMNHTIDAGTAHLVNGVRAWRG